MISLAGRDILHSWSKFVLTGIGLGLASAYGIIRQHKGIIEVSSKKGQGTTFTIYLPASKKEIPRETYAAKTILKGTETILLVDDEPAELEAYSLLLTSLGIIQNIQYYNGAIHWDSMTREAYLDSFGRLHPSARFYNLLEAPDYDKAREGLDR